jgi:ribosomal protein S2
MKNQSKKNNKFLLNKFIQYGLHVGGLQSFWNPKIKAYMSGFRNNFCILDPCLTHRGLRQGLKLLSKVVVSNKKVLFIGSPVGLEKRFLMLCKKHGHYYLDNYTDGFFTNFTNEDKKLLQINLLEERPSLIFFFDISKNEKVKNDVLSLNIPILAFIGSSDDIGGVDYPIPANVNSWKGGLFIYNILYHILSAREKSIVNS